MLSYNNCSKDNNFESFEVACADDVAADDIDVAVFVFTISLVLISSHCCLTAFALQLHQG